MLSSVDSIARTRQLKHPTSIRQRARPISSPQLDLPAFDTFVVASFDCSRTGPMPIDTADAIASGRQSKGGVISRGREGDRYSWQKSQGGMWCYFSLPWCINDDSR